MEDLLLEGNLFGEKIDRNRLTDDSYVRELTKKIRETDKETYNDRKNKQILFTILSTASIIGIVTIPLSFLFDACVKKLENIENTEKELDNLSKIIDKQISNVTKDKNLSIDEKKKIINKLEKNKSIIYKKYTIKKAANSSASSYDGDSIKCGNILLRSVAGSVMNGDLLDIDIEYELDSMNEHKKKYKDNMHFEGYIEELAVFGLNNSSNLMKYIEKNKGNANHYRSDFSKLDGKTLTKIISFTGPDVVVYCHEDKCCYGFSPKYVDEGIKKCSVSQLIQAINKSYKDLLNLQKSIGESAEGEANMNGNIINESFYSDYEYAMGFNANNYRSLPPTMLRGHKTTLENKINKYEQNLKKFKKMDSKERERYIRKLNVANSAQNVGLGIAGGLATGVVINKYDTGLSVSNYQKLTETMIRKLKVELRNIDNILKSKSTGKKIREMADLAVSDNYGLYNSNSFRDEIRESYIDTINSLDTIDSNIIRKDTSLLPVYKIDEGYGIELESLKQVVESTGSLSEAVQEIRDANNIMEVCPMYCILPENINESTTLENFVTLYKSLEKADIKPVSTNAHTYRQFISEAASVENLEKRIKKYEANRDELVKKKKDFLKLSKEEQKKYCVNKTVKNIAVGTALDLVSFGIAGTVYTIYTSQKGDNTILGPKNYVKNLDAYITAYNTDIRAMKAKVRELKSKK